MRDSAFRREAGIQRLFSRLEQKSPLMKLDWANEFHSRSTLSEDGAAALDSGFRRDDEIKA